MASAPYTLFADVLALCQAIGDDLTALLDPEAGFTPRLRQICHDEDDEWEREADAALDKLKSVQVREGPPADHAFHVSQLQIILDRTTPLLEDFANRLKGGSFTPALSTHKPARKGTDKWHTFTIRQKPEAQLPSTVPYALCFHQLS